MSFNLYKKYKLEELSELCCQKVCTSERAAGELPDALSLLHPATIVVQTRGTAEYLRQQIARHCGIAANVNMPFLNNYLNNLLTGIYGESFTAAARASDPGNMRIKIMELLSDENFVRQYTPEIAHYLFDISGRENHSANHELKRWQLSGKIAELFDQYQHYRAGELDELFASGKPGAAWQGRLYKTIFNRNNPGVNWFFTRFLSEELAPAAAARLEKIAVFGVGVLPPIYLDIFLKLGTYTQVDFFYLSPCEEFWENQYSRAELKKLAPWESAESGNPILQALGRQGRGFFSALMQSLDRWSSDPALGESITEELSLCEPVEPDDIPDNSSMLDIMQYDILHLFDRRQAAENEDNSFIGTPRLFLAGDGSIAVHNCHNIRRELEVLHDELIKLIQQGVPPRDILVMAPDIERLAPVINAVFGSGSLRDLYSIADLPGGTGVQVHETFHKLISASSGRFEFSEIISLLDMPLLANCMHLNDEDAEAMHAYLLKSGVRWGYDGAMHEKFSGLNFDSFSWLNGIDRLLAGFANRSLDETPSAVGNISSVQALEGAQLEKFAQIVDFVEKLHNLSADVERRLTLPRWHAVFERMIGDFFSQDNQARTALAPLHQALADLAALQVNKFAHLNYPLNAAQAILDDFWQLRSSGSGRFLRGKITFCRMVPMRSIPMQVVAILDLNEKDFPRRDSELGFDLIAADRRLSDRSVAVQDRYLLLEALMSARKHLLLFYQGQSARDNQERPPSPALQDIMSYLGNAFGLQEYKHKVSGINEAYYDSSSDALPVSLNKENYNAILAVSRHNAELNKELEFGLAAEEVAEKPLLMTPDLTDITIDELCAYLSNPCRWLARNQLELYLDKDFNFDTDSEPFYFTNTRWQIDRLAMEKILQSPGQPVTEQILQLAQQSNLVPPGVLGEHELRKRVVMIQNLPEKWQCYFQQMERRPVSCKLTLSGTATGEVINAAISGMVNITPDGLTVLCYRWSAYDIRTALSAMVSTLVTAICTHKAVKCQILNLTENKFVTHCIYYVQPEDAVIRLQEILHLAQAPMSVPPAIFPGTVMKKKDYWHSSFLKECKSDPNIKIYFAPDDWSEQLKRDMERNVQILFDDILTP